MSFSLRCIKQHISLPFRILQAPESNSSGRSLPEKCIYGVPHPPSRGHQFYFNRVSIFWCLFLVPSGNPPEYFHEIVLFNSVRLPDLSLLFCQFQLPRDRIYFRSQESHRTNTNKYLTVNNCAV